MPRTYRQCSHCYTWRTDVRERAHVLDDGGLCPHCTRVAATPTKSRAAQKQAAAPPQEGGRDRFARLERAIGRDLQAIGEARKRGHTDVFAWVGPAE